MDTAEQLLRELWPDLPDTWDEDLSGCRFQCGGNTRDYKDGKWNETPHDPTCIYRRIGEYIDATANC